MINWGFIGCGSVTEQKSGPAFKKVDGSDVVAVMSRDGNKAKDYAERHSVANHYDNAYNLLANTGVNAVYVATPPGSHAEYAMAAIKLGKPVYLEKPMASSYWECELIGEMACREGVDCFVAYYRRTLPYFQKVKQLIDGGEIGEVTDVQIKLINPPYESDNSKDTLSWRVKPDESGAGYFYDLASHQFDFLDFFFGPIIDAKGTAQNVAGLYDVEDTVDADFTFENGIKGQGHWEFAASVDERIDEVIITGSKGTIKLSTFLFTPIVLTNAKGEQQFTEENPDNIQYYLIKSINDYLNGNGEYPVSDYRSAMRTNWVMDKILGRL